MWGYVNCNRNGGWREYLVISTAADEFHGAKTTLCHRKYCGQLMLIRIQKTRQSGAILRSMILQNIHALDE